MRTKSEGVPSSMPRTNGAPRIDGVVRSARRTVGLEVTSEGLLLVRAPKRAPQRLLEQAVAERAEWVRLKQAEALARRALHPPKRCLPGEPFELFGRVFLLRPEPGRAAARAFPPDEGVTSGGGSAPGEDSVPGGGSAPGILAVPAGGAETRAAIEAWYRTQALEHLRERTAFFARRAGARVLSVRVTGALSHWGSCRAGHICFTWRLALAPADAADYVAAHEVAHIAHPDHSAAFWAAVAALLPDYERRRALLRTHAALLRPDFFASP